MRDQYPNQFAVMDREVQVLLIWPPFTPSLMEDMILTTPGPYMPFNPISNREFWDQNGYDLRPPNLEAAEDMLAALARQRSASECR